MRKNRLLMSARMVFVVAAAALFLFSATCHAGKKEDKEARTQFKQGVALFEEGKYEQAAIAFARAYELKPSYKLLFNIGQTENELGHYTAALQAYERYMEEGGAEVKKKRRELVESEIERLRALVGKIAVTGDAEGAKIFVDNRLAGEEPLDEPLEMDIGSHEVVVKLAGKEIHREVVTVAGGATSEVKWMTPKDQPVIADVPDSPQEPAEDDGPKRIWTWVALGVGAAAGVTGGVLGGVALSKKNDILDNCEEDLNGDSHCLAADIDERDKVKNLSLTADILYGVALAGVAAGVVLFFVEPKLGEEDDGASVVAVPTASEDTLGLTITGRF